MLKGKKGISLIVLVLIVVVVIVIGAISIVLVVNRDDSVVKDNNLQITDDNNNQDSDKKFYEEWGLTDHCAAESDGPAESFYINFPYFTGGPRGYGLAANQGDGTTVFIFGQNDYAPEISKLSELFPAYFEQLQYTLEKVYGLRASNFELSLESDAPVVIGEYDMHTFTGNIAFDYEGKPKDYNFVAYATTLKSNGAYAYWVVYDTSDNQSNGKLIKEHAYNMAKTFREEK